MQIEFDNEYRTIATVIAYGSFSTTFTVPIQVYGPHIAMATDTVHNVFATRSFSIIPNLFLITPNKGTVGTKVVIKGNGFNQGIIDIIFGIDLYQRRVEILSNGSFKQPFTITVTQQPYGATAIIGSQSAEVKAYESFTILPNIYRISPPSGIVGNIVTVFGDGYGVTDNIQIDFGTTISIVLTTANNLGTFSAIFTVNAQRLGSITITATGITAGSSTAYFVIVPQIIEITPTRGTVGTKITLVGDGYSSSGLVRISFGLRTAITTITASSVGSFTVIFTVDTQFYGTKSVTAVDVTSSQSAYLEFCILPNIILITPMEGTVGRIITISGNGFGANNLIRISFGKTTTITAISSVAQGSFTTTFTINTQPAGITTIKAVDLTISGVEASGTFTILPNIHLL